ncbi:MAG: DUF1028 domain-containing protein [Acidimicrobiales bacterium]
MIGVRPPSAPPPVSRVRFRRWRRMVAGGVLFGGAVVAGWAAPAGATWSVAATDADTGEVGVAVASCVPVETVGDPAALLPPAVVVPGLAAGVVQGQIDLAPVAEMTELINAGLDPRTVVDRLVIADGELAAVRQYAVVDLAGTSVGVTGDEVLPESGWRSAPGASAQANLTASPEVVGDTIDGFVVARAEGADLAGALVAGLAAGSRAGGDRRCPASTALFAHVAVAGATDAPGRPSFVTTVSVDEGDTVNPVEELVAAVAAGRTGAIDAAQHRDRGGGWVTAVALGFSLAAVTGGLWIFRRGLGARQARR